MEIMTKMSVTSTIILTAIMIIFLIVFKCSYEREKKKMSQFIRDIIN